MVRHGDRGNDCFCDVLTLVYAFSLSHNEPQYLLVYSCNFTSLLLLQFDHIQLDMTNTAAAACAAYSQSSNLYQDDIKEQNFYSNFGAYLVQFCFWCQYVLPMFKQTYIDQLF